MRSAGTTITKAKRGKPAKTQQVAPKTKAVTEKSKKDSLRAKNQTIQIRATRKYTKPDRVTSKSAAAPSSQKNDSVQSEGSTLVTHAQESSSKKVTESLATSAPKREIALLTPKEMSSLLVSYRLRWHLATKPEPIIRRKKQPEISKVTETPVKNEQIVTPEMPIQDIEEECKSSPNEEVIEKIESPCVSHQNEQSVSPPQLHLEQIEQQQDQQQLVMEPQIQESEPAEVKMLARTLPACTTSMPSDTSNKQKPQNVQKQQQLRKSSPLVPQKIEPRFLYEQKHKQVLNLLGISDVQAKFGDQFMDEFKDRVFEEHKLEPLSADHFAQLLAQQTQTNQLQQEHQQQDQNNGIVNQ